MPIEKEEIKENTKPTEKKPPVHTNDNQKMIIGVMLGAGVVTLLVVGGFGVKRFMDNRTGLVTRGGFGIQREFGGQEMGRGMMGGRGKFLGHNDLSENSVTGKVTAVNDKQFTVSVNSTSKTVQITDTTRFPNTSATKVVVGDTVVILGEQDASGVIQAARIVVNPTSS